MDKVPTNKRGLVTSQDVSLDKEYIEWIHELKSRFRNSQIKAAVKVNSEQLLFNWQLGRDLVVRKAEEKWGTGIVNQVSLDLQAEFPEAKGFSARNLWNIKNGIYSMLKTMVYQIYFRPLIRSSILKVKNCNKLLQKYMISRTGKN